MTNCVKRLVALVPVFACTASAIAAVTATLHLEPTSSLPGVPVAMLITVTNSSDLPVTINQAVTLHAAPPTGDFFDAASGDTLATEALSPEDMTIQAGGSRDYY